MTTDQAPAAERTAADPRRTVEVRVPGDATLVPGVAGRGHDAAASCALVDALREALQGAVRVRVTVDGASPGSPWSRAVPDLGAQGVDETWVPWRFAGNDDAPGGRRAGVAATVALLALGAAGWAGPVEVLDDGPAGPPGTASAGREGATVHVERAC
ncbi:hypothetical protein [Luteimicrobium sp. DT211]|uniref:hypothetical protein n=1 Tax=Luteimicrobium sp. DT211 TaxID=3393412 RepID=UPI003CFABB66